MLRYHRSVDPQYEQFFFNNGNGQDSAAMWIAYRDGLLPKELYDLNLHIAFADPGDEHDLTYAWARDYFVPEIEKHAQTMHWLTPESETNGTKASPYHVTKTGRVIHDIITQYGMDVHPSFPMRGSGGRCTETHKQMVLARFRNAKRLEHCGRDAHAQTKAGNKDIVLVGIAADETSRILPSPHKNYEIYYPLVELGWDRKKCQEVIQAAGLPLPPKSGCNVCPFAPSFHYWLLSQKWPKRFQRIVDLEQKCIDDRMARLAAGESTRVVYILDQFKAPIAEAVELWHASNQHITVEMAEEMLYKTHYAVDWKGGKVAGHQCQYMDWGIQELLAQVSAR